MTQVHGPARPVTPVGILARKLQDLEERLETVADLDPELRAELRQAVELAGGLDPYISRCTTPESSALAALVRRTEDEDWSRRSTSVTHLEREMLSGHVEGQVLKFLVHLSRATRVLEIGMFTGYSALAMAEALPEDGVVVACEVDAEVSAFARRCFDDSPAGHKISVRVAPARTTLAELAAAGESFDLVFIDADKPAYGAYLDAVLDGGLLAPGGVVCVDNTLLQGEPYVSAAASANGEAVAAFNEQVAGDARLEQVMLPLRDGLTLIRTV